MQHALGWKGPLKAIQSNPPAMSRDIFNSIRLLGGPFHLTLNVSRDGASTASLGNPFQCFTTVIVKNVFLLSRLNLPSFSLKLLEVLKFLKDKLSCQKNFALKRPPDARNSISGQPCWKRKSWRVSLTWMRDTVPSGLLKVCTTVCDGTRCAILCVVVVCCCVC